ncbi:multicopper oxidase-domain-containing protein [Aspergillus undulatus]|uniref:multicopper oxidase-domain-containing protein n=1 Tax=Aspergillus undulatus TaxID=1810928 RepID=UPI003CCD0451
MILAGKTFLYKWRATSYGSYYYHGHTRRQQVDGVYGATRILPTDTIENPFAAISDDQGKVQAMENAEANSTPIMLSDKAEKASGRDALCASALLLNGKGSVNCLGPDTIERYTTTPMKGILGNQSLTDIGEASLTISAPFLPTLFSGCRPSQGLAERLYADATETYVSYNLISAAFISTVTFSIDERPMYVYAEYVEPILVDAITVTNGVRYSVLVKLDKPAGDYTIRVANTGVNLILQGTALLTYHNGGEPQKPSVPSIDLVGTLTSPEYTLLNESTIVPFKPHNVAQVKVAETHILKLERFPLALEDASPLLFYPKTGRENLTVSHQNGTWIDIVFDVANAVQAPNPIHKHSNKFFVLGRGEGRWNYSSVAEAVQHMPESFNFETPQIRDTFATTAASMGPTWLAIRYHVTNPGAFLLHCHIQVHQCREMVVALLGGIDEWPELPEEYQLEESELEKRTRY